MKISMKKQAGKATALLLVALLAFVMLPVTVLAATGNQDGLSVSMTTDKSSYAAGDTVTVNLSITNNNAAVVSNVKLEVTLPSGLTLQSGSATLTIASLAAGATETHSFTARATTSSTTDTTTTTTPQPTDSTTQTGSPQTGDGSNFALWVALLILSVGGLAGLVYFKKRKAAKLLSMLLCLTMLTALVAPALSVFAATVTKDFSISESITVDGNTKKITLKTSYDWEEVTPAVNSVTVTPSTASATIGTAITDQQLTATVSVTGGAAQTVTWSVYDAGTTGAGKVTVSADGKLNVAADAVAGTAVIRATSTVDASKYGTCTVTVSAAPVGVTGVTLNANTASLSVGGIQSLSATAQLTPTVAPSSATNQNVTWESSAPGVASVNNGLVTAESAGTATITVKTVDGEHTDTCVVTVGSLAASNAEAAKITGFTEGTNTTSTLVFNATGYSNLTSGTTVALEDVKTGASSPGATTSLGESLSSGVLSLNTQQVVVGSNNYNNSFPHELAYVSVTFTTTYNGVTSDSVTLDISSLFGAGTTAAKLRNDIAALGTGKTVGRLPSNTTGDVPLSPSITLSSGVSIPQINHNSTSNGGQGYMHADAGGVVYVYFTLAPTGMGGIKFKLTLECAGTTVQVHDNYDVIVIFS